MSSNKTTNYSLHAWVPQDEFHLTEINENFALLDAALKAEAGSREALAELLNSRVRMVTGSYAGQNAFTTPPQTPFQVELGLKPKAVVILNTYRGISGVDLSFLAVEGGINNNAVTLTETGFAVINIEHNGAYMNYRSTTYHYIAFY